MMHYDSLQQNAFQNPQPGNPNLQHLVQSLLQNTQNQQGGGFGQFGHGAYGAQFGQAAYGAPFGGGQSTTGWGWGAQQRQLSQHDVGNILQQIAPVLPQIIAQAQQAPYQAMAAFGGNSRSLSPQDVSEVVRQILPIIPQLLQSMPQQNGPWGPAQVGYGPMMGQGIGFGQLGQGWQGQAAFGQQPSMPQQYQTRPLTSQDVNEIARQLSEVVQQQAYVGQPNGYMRV